MPATPDFWDKLRANALALRAQPDRAIMVVVGCNLFEWGTFLRRMDNFLMDLIAEPEQVERLLDALMEIHLRTLEKVCRAVGDVVDICRFGDDLGTDTGPFMAPATYRQLFKPRHARLCDYVHRHSGDEDVPAFLRLDPRAAAGPDRGGLRRDQPGADRLPRHGAGALKRDSAATSLLGRRRGHPRHPQPRHPAEVRKDVLDRLEIFAPGGGFVFNTIHNILPDVPPENIVAMFDAIEEYNTAGA